MKMKLLIISITIPAFFINFSGKPGAPRPEKNPPAIKVISISFSGAYSLYPLTQLWAAEYNKTHPDVRFDIQSGGAGKGLTDCISGAVDVAMFSRELTP